MALTDILQQLQAQPPLTLLAMASLLLLASLLVQIFRVYGRLAHIPGPWPMGLTNLVMAHKMTSGKSHDFLAELAHKHGSIVRIGPKMVAVSDPRTLRRVAGVRSEYTRSVFYEITRITPGVDNIFSMRDEKMHKALKSKLGGGYTGRENGGFEAGINKQVASFVNLIESKYLSTATEYRPMDLAMKCTYFSLDVISELGFGEAFGFLAQDRDLYHFIKINHKFLPFAVFIGTVPLLINLLGKWPLNTLGPAAGDSAGFGKLMQFAAEFVDKRTAPGAKPGKDMIQSFINNGIPREELMQEVWVETTAGSDSTASTIRGAFLCLLGTPTALSRLRDEIDGGISAGTISSPITDAEARKLPYLQAVIKESLRTLPPATGMMPKTVPSGGDSILGYKLPAGTEVSSNIAGMLRLPELWGDDREAFRPERWLDAEEAGDADRLREMNAAVELIFGHGKYHCLGRTMAQMELNKIFVELLRRFDFAVINPLAPARAFCAAIHLMDNFWVRVTKREAAR